MLKHECSGKDSEEHNAESNLDIEILKNTSGELIPKYNGHEALLDVDLPHVDIILNSPIVP